MNIIGGDENGTGVLHEMQKKGRYEKPESSHKGQKEDDKGSMPEMRDDRCEIRKIKGGL